MQQLKLILIFFMGLILCGFTFHSSNAARTVTNEELKDALMSLVHSYSVLDNKLERHEQRERSLGELIKKALLQLQKGQRPFETIKGTFVRLEERVSQIETMIITQDERHIMQETKLAEALGAVLKWMTDNTGLGPSSKYIVAKTDSEEDENEVSRKIDDLADNVRGLRREIAELRADRKTAEISSKELLAQTERLLKSKLESADEVITKLEEKLTNFYLTTPLTTPAPPVTIPVGNPEWEKQVTEALTDIRIKMNKVHNVPTPPPPPPPVNLPDKNFLMGLNNETLEAIEKIKQEVLINSDKVHLKTVTALNHNQHELQSSMGKILKSSLDASIAAETLFADAAKTQESLKNDVKELGKLEAMLSKLGENSLENKRKVEFVGLQTTLDIGDIIRATTTDLNDTLVKRFDDLGETILDNNMGSLTNLSTKIETEISHVWRQIAIMHQEMLSNKVALDRLQKQTESYVNGTTTIMDGMGSKVGQINSRMLEIDSNLNYLLGRLSLVMQEFNQIKQGLSVALENLKGSFKTVQDQIKDIGPGPHLIPDDDKSRFNFLAQQEKNSTTA